MSTSLMPIRSAHFSLLPSPQNAKVTGKLLIWHMHMGYMCYIWPAKSSHVTKLLKHATSRLTAAS